MTGPITAPGRPLRALAGLLLVSALWLAARLPGVEQRFRTAVAAGVAKPQVRRLDRGDQSMAPAIAEPAAVPAGDAEIASPVARPRATPPGSAVPARLALAATLAEPLALPPPSPADPALAPSPTAAPQAQPPRPVPASGFDLATRAYAALAKGDRRSAAQLFGAALAADKGVDAGEDAPQADTWLQAQQRLMRRWSGDAYTLRRDTGIASGGGGGGGGAASSPVLGGGQSGGTLAWAIDPLAARPVAVIGRIYAAHTVGGGIDGRSAQAAVGLRWQVVPGLSVAAERLVAVGQDTAGDWNLRVAGGGQRRLGLVTIDGYGEAGVRGNGDAYAGGQARAMAAIARARGLVFSGGPGAWGSIQHSRSTVGRLDLGAGVTMATPVGVAVSADWRWRIAGNAAPGSGPAVTISAAF